jgi:drug/metabolite transporter (DMT)-like permease
MNWRAELALAGVCLIWGSTFVLVKNALDDVSTILFLALRFSAATVLLGGLYLARGGRLTNIKAVRGGAFTGVFLYAGYVLQTMGLRWTTPATSGFITGLYIVMVPLFAAALYRKMPGVSEWLGVILATAGMALMTLRGADLAVGTGELLTVGCAVAFAAQILALSHYSRRIGTDLLTLLQIGTSAAVALATFWWVEDVHLRWSAALITAIVVTSVFATAVAFWLQTWAQARTTPTRAAVIFSLEPVFAWLTSWLLEGEVLTGRAVAGAACILAGILAVELKPFRAR